MSLLLSIFLYSICILSQGLDYDFSRENIYKFMDQYNKNPPKRFKTSPLRSFLNIITALENWSIESNMKLPDPSKYPYFRWMPFYQNSTIPSKPINRVTFDPMYCFSSGAAYSEIDPSNASNIILTIELSNKTQNCTAIFLFGTVSKVSLKEIIVSGRHRIHFPIHNLSPSQQWDLDTKGIRILTFLDSPEQTLADAIETVSLFECLETERVLPKCAEKSVQFLSDYANVIMEKRNTTDPVWKHIDESLIQSGDFFGVIRLDGLDPVLAWGMGAHTGHSVIAMREDDGTLYIMESQDNSSYWPVNGIQKTEYNLWMKQATEAGYCIIWEPLNENVRAQFNVTAAIQFFEANEYHDYGFQTMLTGWIDTAEDNYPCLPPDFKMCLTWNTLEIGLAMFDRLIPGFEVMIIPAFNQRLNTTNLSLSDLYYQAYLNGIKTEDLPTMVESDEYMYDIQLNNGSYVKGLAMVCCDFVCHMYKMGGLFDSVGMKNVNCNEFTNFDVYGAMLFNSSFPQDRPQICKEKDPNNPLCQMMGEYTLVLENWNSVELHAHMAEDCPSQPPDYKRPSDC